MHSRVKPEAGSGRGLGEMINSQLHFPFVSLIIFAPTSRIGSLFRGCLSRFGFAFPPFSPQKEKKKTMKKGSKKKKKERKRKEKKRSMDSMGLA